ncbi:tRNA pseudouridine(38-40) synthase TruA [Amphritea balenae]|uniref:tRNA pseudouridine synthase A n=1 Tax=Amphritea balenae TaxID=452629 RepID=A0A3P1SL04_9GAMM|nr:tRNA pseudouridine(38-40) synthase TruA [Amphritea balenae]RRC97747.1 tRNA pseudouridine(38-40) synthase TruA [Amphritea balenae]GGK82714.1 tRNA pseudouridine synthase A [Amphritea balenae]
MQERDKTQSNNQQEATSVASVDLEPGSSENSEKTKVKLRRYALCVEYAGGNYRGWQTQKEKDVPTVQETVEQALSKIANHPVSVVCAGRTDACVSGTYQIIHFDTHAERSERGWVMGTNTKLPDEIAIRWAKPVDDSFHARFSALERRYRYLIYSSPVKPALLAKGVTWTHKRLNLEAMQEASGYLVGEHDFSSYRAIACQANSPIREVRAMDIYRSGELIIIDVRANAFLHHMIRNFAGVLMTIGAGEASPVWAKEVLDAKDRAKGGVTAPPYGLYFVDVKYPSEYELPKSSLGPYFLTQNG